MFNAQELFQRIVHQNHFSNISPIRWTYKCQAKFFDFSKISNKKHVFTPWSTRKYIRASKSETHIFESLIVDKNNKQNNMKHTGFLDQFWKAAWWKTYKAANSLYVSEATNTSKDEPRWARGNNATSQGTNSKTPSAIRHTYIAHHISETTLKLWIMKFR